MAAVSGLIKTSVSSENGTNLDAGAGALGVCEEHEPPSMCCQCHLAKRMVVRQGGCFHIPSTQARLLGPGMTVPDAAGEEELLDGSDGLLIGT